MEDKEKKTINLRLYTAVMIGVVVILVAIYIVMFSINKHNSVNKHVNNVVSYNTFI